MNNNLDIIFFGDSLTFGYGVNKKNSWVDRITQKANYNSLNKAKNGDTTPSMLSRYNNDVLRYLPSKIFLMGGTNDLLCGRTVTSIIENIEIMIKEAITIKVEIIIGIPPVLISSMANDMFSPSPFYDYAEKKLFNLRTELIKLCTKYEIKYINFYDLPLNHKNLFIDGLHLKDTGHEIMFKQALKVLT